MIQHLLCIKVSTIKEYQAILTIGHLFIFNILHRILYVLSFITYIKMYADIPLCYIIRRKYIKNTIV